MESLSVDIEVNAPATQAWAVIGNFSDVAWDARVESFEVEDLAGRPLRRVRLSPELPEIEELLETQTDSSYVFVDIGERDTPLRELRTTLQIAPKTEGSSVLSCTVEFKRNWNTFCEDEDGTPLSWDPADLLHDEMMVYLNCAKYAIETAGG